MVILGAGGFAKEILQVVEKNFADEIIAFYDDVSLNLPSSIYDKYPIINNIEELKIFFKTHSPNFVIGIGNSKAREAIQIKAIGAGGNLVSAIDKNTLISTYASIENGATILNNVSISNSVYIGKSALIYYNVVVTHDCIIGDYVELSPGATLLGKVQIGDYTQVGANATVLPKIKVGTNCIIGAGAVVTKDVPDNSIVIGAPARVIKSNI